MNYLLKNTIITEFESHAEDAVNGGRICLENRDDWHHILFNEDYYIIGYYAAEQWLEKHNVSAFEAISACITYEKDNFGVVCKTYDNTEMTVNMLVYVLGEYWLYHSEGIEFIESLDGLYPEPIIVCDRASLRPDDLFDAFFTYIVGNETAKAELDSTKATFEFDMVVAYRNWLVLDDEDFETYIESINPEDVSYALNEELFDFMDKIAPENMYFGSSEGDGSLFGFWPDKPE